MLSNLSLQNLPGQFSHLNTAWKVRLAVAGAYASYVGAKVAYYVYKRVTNRQKRLEKQRENAESIEQLSKLLDADPISASLVSHITRLTLEELCRELKEGKIRPIEALKAYQVKALEAHHKTNCLVEVIKEAEELALKLEKGPKDGDLWGVPISIKDDVGIKGYDSAIGMVIKIGKPSEDDSNLVKAFRREGAIPFVKTNVPQTEMSFEPGNPINGVVHNPHKRGHGPGGSSSGEGALIASGGSILGIGSDIAGSIRVPSHFCGVFGFKPTSERVSTRGMSLDYETVIPIRACWGPISRDVNGLVAALRAWWKRGEINKTDPESVPMLFDEKEFASRRKLRVGYYVDNEIFPTFSACVRAVDMAKDIFRKGGHELVPWSPPHPDRIMEMVMRVLKADGGDLMAEELKYDVLHPTIHEVASPSYTPTWIMKLISMLIYPMSPKTATAIIHSCGSGSVAHNYEMIHEMWQLRRVIQDSWNEAGLDVVICPPQVGAAPPFGSSTYLWRTCLYTATYNLLHFPAGVVPVTKVQQRDLNQLDSDFPPVDQLHRTAKNAMSKTLNLPVGVMVASPRYQDEVCLRAMKILEDGLEHRVEQLLTI